MDFSPFRLPFNWTCSKLSSESALLHIKDTWFYPIKMAILLFVFQYNPFLVYCRELAPGTVSLTGDRAQGDDSKHDSHYRHLQEIK